MECVRPVNELEGVGPSARQVWEYLEEACSSELFAVKEAVLCDMQLGPVKLRVQGLAKRWGLRLEKNVTGSVCSQEDARQKARVAW